MDRTNKEKQSVGNWIFLKKQQKQGHKLQLHKNKSW